MGAGVYQTKFTVTWKDQGNLPLVGDIVLFENEPIYKNPLSAARVDQLLCGKNRDIYGATISYHRELVDEFLTEHNAINQ